MHGPLSCGDAVLPHMFCRFFLPAFPLLHHTHNSSKIITHRRPKQQFYDEPESATAPTHDIPPSTRGSLASAAPFVKPRPQTVGERARNNIGAGRGRTLSCPCRVVG